MEIGGEFCKTEDFRSDISVELNYLSENKKYFISGRSALGFIINDIKMKGKCTSVLMPSYCCYSMLQPFLRNDFSIRFYDVYFDKNGLNAEIPCIQPDEILYYLTYFGFNKLNVKGIDIRKVQIMIRDKTHSWLCKEEDIEGTYSFVSYRKWLYVSGLAEACINTGAFKNSLKGSVGNTVIRYRNEAAELKRKYLINEVGDKSEYLNLYAMAEELLDKSDFNYLPETQAIDTLINTDFVQIADQRRKNAKYLIERLKKIDGLNLIFDSVEENDVPLVVPILIEQSKRDLLRIFLIKNNVYCPIHWPLSSFHKNLSSITKSIYKEELSLICDQRYSRKALDRQISLIENFFSYD